MGKITAAIALSHAPLMAEGAESDPAPEEQVRNVYAGFAQLREELAASNADLLLVIVDDHF
jgi:hypothetical protein